MNLLSILKISFKRDGFTLIELIIVMAIIGLLALFVTANYRNASGKARDARRKSDLVSLQKGLELYYEDNGQYPGTVPNKNTSLCHPDGCAVKIYVPTVPTDPQNSSAYTYCSSAATGFDKYQIYATLENANDRQLVTPNGSVCLSPTCDSVGSHKCFGVSSSNVTAGTPYSPP